MNFIRTALSALIIFSCAFGVTLATSIDALAQSRPQKADGTPSNQKRNTRPDPKLEEERKLAEEEKNAVVEDIVERIELKIVNVDTVVYHKKSGEIISGLKRENFTIFENGVKKDISNFSAPETPITVTLVVEYSRWSELFGSAGGGRFEPGTHEVIRPVSLFLSRFIKPPDDYASVIAFDKRPTTITDFTNDPARLRNTVDLLLRNTPAFTENNLFDSLKFALVGGEGDSVVLENEKSRTAQFGGMVDVKSKRRAIILVASGINTFSRTSYDEARRIIQEAGIPIYIISTGNLFYKKYEHLLGPMDGISGMPGRLTFLQAQNTMNTLAKESGGMHFPMTFSSEVPDYLNSINAMLRSQYSLAYDLDDKYEAGKKYKIEVKVDVNGDGIPDDKTYVVRHRPFYTTPKPEKKK